MSSLPHLCRVVTVERDDLPPGHDFIIVKHPADGVVIYADADDRAQMEARRAFLVWDRLRDTAPSSLGPV